MHIALGITDMCKGLDGLAMLVQGVLEQDPFSGHLFAFRGRKANLIKIVFWDGTGLCLFTKRLEALETKVAEEGIILTEAQVQALEKKKFDDEAWGEIETAQPGYLGSQDTFYVGTLKGVGRIYQQTYIDTYAKTA